MPRARYLQASLPIGPGAPPPTIYGPERPLPPGLRVATQGQLELGVAVLGPLFEQVGERGLES